MCDSPDCLWEHTKVCIVDDTVSGTDLCAAYRVLLIVFAGEDIKFDLTGSKKSGYGKYLQGKQRRQERVVCVHNFEFEWL
jgi:hypothetical protein